MAENKVVWRLRRQVRTALEKAGLGSGKLVVVAVSGGPDSTAMLGALAVLGDELRMRLHGAHLDHGLRGDASREDARFVADTFRRLGIDHTVEAADVPSFQRENRLSMEEAARSVRYGFLARVAAETEADAIALGHTADDQAETVLMHIIRGTGLTGLRGMEPAASRIFGGTEVLLVRPLIGLSHRDALEYCRALKLEYRQDESNLSLDPQRNRVRLELLPILETYNPAVRNALVRLSSSAAQDLAYLDTQVERAWEEAGGEDGTGVTLSRAAFSKLAPALQSHLLRRAVRAAKGDAVDLEQSHVDRMARLMGGRAGTNLDLPGGITFRVGYQEATLAAAGREVCPLPPIEEEQPIAVPGETVLGGWRVIAGLTEGRRMLGVGDGPASNGPLPNPVERFDANGLEGEVLVRSRVDGDRFQPLGMGRSKKLQDFMVDAKIPRGWRDRVPLVVSPRGIAWVVGWRIAEWAKVTETEPQIELRFIRR